jgi:GDPmannose 4,6-dehydratase
LKKVAFITGITGMDGSHLSDYLLTLDYKIYGLIRRTTSDSLWRIKHIIDKITLIQGDLLDQASLDRAIQISQPEECYHLGAQSFVKHSFEAPEYTINVTGLGTLRMLEAIRNYKKNCKFFFAGSSEQFGKVKETPQNENTPFYPRSPYGVAKVMGYEISRNYREAYNMFISCGISYNHESERRSEEFVSRKITRAVAQMKKELIETGEIKSKLVLGNLDAQRDFGYAPDYVKGFWQMLQQDIPDDYVLATGVTNSIRAFVETAFKLIGVVDWNKYVKISDEFKRPTEVDFLMGDATKAREKLNWMPTIGFEEMIKKMIEADYE